MRRSRRWTFLVGTALVAAAVAVAGMPAADAAPFRDEPLDPPPVYEDPPFDPPANGFDWRAPSRFGRDDNGDGITDYHWNDLDDTRFAAFDRPPEHGGPPETYDPAWVHPSSFPIDFDGCATKEEAARSNSDQPTENTYTWVIDGQTYQRRDCRLVDEIRFPAEGTYTASLTVTGPDGTTHGPYHQDVLVRDLLIVSIGDSYGSGEGNPDKAQVVGIRNGTPVTERPAQWVDKRCHRSADAGAAQAARRIEGSDPKTTVTFLSFACSGATIDTLWSTNPVFPYAPLSEDEVFCLSWRPEGVPRSDCTNPGTGILGPYKGAEPPPGAPYLPSQLDQLKRAVRHPTNGSVRTIDSLVISGGGNDAGFAPVAAVCVLVLENCMDSWVDNKFSPGNHIQLPERFGQDVGTLAGKYNLLQQGLAASGVPIARTYVTEYPGSTTGDGGAPCSAMLDDVLRPNAFGLSALFATLALIFPALIPVLLVLGPLAVLWSQTRSMAGDEVVWAGNTIAPSINGAMRAAADRHGWTYVSGIGDPYVGHGYCASDPYIRRASEASWVQGPLGEVEAGGINSATKGTLHPNVTGHRMYANQLVPRLAAQFALRAGSADFTVSERIGDSESRHGRAGWLTGRCQNGSQDCNSDAVDVTVEARDPSGLKGAEFTVNGRPECPVEVRCTARLVDPFTYRWTFTIASDGIWPLGFSVSNRFGHLSTFGRDVKVDLHDPIATAATESTRAPTALRFGGTDGRGSGIEQITFNGLWHGNSPGSTGPGGTVAIDLGGAYTVNFRATDEAGRTGPLQTQSLTLAGPTMDAGARVDQSCSGIPGHTVRNDNDGRPVASRTERTDGVVNPIRGSMAAGARTVWNSADQDSQGRVFCTVNNRLDHVPLRVEAGSSGLQPGDPVTLTAVVRFSGSLNGGLPFCLCGQNGPVNSTYTTSTWFQTWLAVENAEPPPSCEDMCRYAMEFSARAQHWDHTNMTTGEPDGSIGYNDWLWSNIEGEKSSNRIDEGGFRRRFLSPQDTFTVTFQAHVGERYLINGYTDVSGMAASHGAGAVHADAEASSKLDIAPASGFDGIDLVYGEQQPNLPPQAVDDAVTLEDDEPVTVDVLANDVDVDGDSLTVTDVSGATHGTTTIGPDGKVTYTPAADFPGRDSFSYTVSDGKGATATATVRIRARGTRAPAADFDGDGDTDVAVFRPSDGHWFVKDGPTVHWGTAGDIAVPGDYDGDGRTDMAVFRPSNGVWFVKGGATVAWGTEGDIPVPGDYDGDGDTDVAVFRPSLGLWFVRDGLTTVYGAHFDVPVPGDYDGDGDTDVAVFRPEASVWFVQGATPEFTQYGEPCESWSSVFGRCDVAAPFDHDGDGDTDKALFRPTGGLWLVSGATPETTSYGTEGDIPVPGDYNGDRRGETAVFRPSMGLWFLPGAAPEAVGWGTSGDQVLPLAPSIRSVYFP